MGLLSTLRFITTHPLTRGHKLRAVGRFVRWQVGTRLLQAPVVVDYVNGTRLVVSRGMTGATGNVYVGLHEFEDMAFVGHLLRPGDLFIDVGANIGSYSILAASCGADVIAFEPVRATFDVLQANIRLNDFQAKVRPECKGVADSAGQLSFTTTLDTMNRATTTGEVGDPVAAVKLDDVIPAGRDCVLKIDVEGFEARVIAGAEQLLRSGRVIAVLVELNGSGLRYGSGDSQVHQALVDCGFRAYAYDPLSRSIRATNPGDAANTIYTGVDLTIRERLRAGSKLLVWGHEI